MGLGIDFSDGQTPLEEEEKEQLLIPSITTRKELDEFEQHNIEKAFEWTISLRIKSEILFTEDFVRKLHHKMFADVWKWAGEFRKSDKNFGCDWQQIGVLLKQLNDDSNYWLNNKIYSEQEIAIRYKHRIVTIHCFPNGNGRHSRLMADLIISKIFRKPVFTWSRGDIANKGKAREKYLDAIRVADDGDIKPLIEFACT